jgi:serine/threonine-protein kinase
MATVSDDTGRVLAGRYRLQGLLGLGASARVYDAVDLVLERPVAVKLLHPSLAEDAAFVRRFTAEARAAAALTHPGVVAVFDWGEEGGQPFLVLQRFDGSLRDLLDGGQRLSLAQAVALGAQVAGGLAYAHRRGLVHRDLSPGNVLLDQDGRAAVGDFGLARALEAASWTEPVGAVLGTARYAAPERAGGGPATDRADVYGLALVLVEAVTGTVPLVADSPLGTVLGRVGRRLPPLPALGPLEALLAQAAAPEPADRPSAEELARSLEELGRRLPPPEAIEGFALRGAPVPALERTEPAPALAPATAAGVVAPAPAEDPVPAPLPPGRRRRGWLIAAALLVVLAALAGVGVWRSGVLLPRHRLVSLVGRPETQAARVVRAEGLRLRVLRRRYQVESLAGDVLREIPAPGTWLRQGATVAVVVSLGPPLVSVPDLGSVSGGCSAVVALLDAHRLRGSCREASSTTVPAGRVLRWSPTGRAPEGSTVSVVVSSGPPLVAVPSLAGISSCAGVASALQAAGLRAACSTQPSLAQPAGAVLSESPTGRAPAGSTVTVVLSSGPPPVTVPNVENDVPLPQAVTELQGAGLVVGPVYGPGGGVVFHTSPGPGQVVPRGTVVTVYTQ